MKSVATVALRAVPRAAVALPPAWRRRVAILLAVLAALVSGYLLWFRDSSFVKVQKVRITGLSGPQAPAIRRALVDAGLGMTTLDVQGPSLRDAVATYPVVRSISATGQFPHLLVIQVDLNLPVALLQTPAGTVPVAADGLVLRDVPITPGLPVLQAGTAATTGRLTSGQAFGLLRVVAGSPEPLRSRITTVEAKGALGLVAHLQRGPDLIFGDTSALDAKWMAAARVLAAPAARGATYIDVRLPERPAAGGLPTTSVIPLAPAGSTLTSPARAVTTQGTGTTTAPAGTSTTTTPATTTQRTATTPSSGTQAPVTRSPVAPRSNTTPAPTQQAPSATTGGGIQPPG